MIKLCGSRIIIKFERPLNIAEVVVLILEEARDHVSEMLLILFGPSFVRCACVALFLDDSCGVIKRPTRNEAFLASCSLNIQDDAICWELLTLFNFQNVAGLDISPGDQGVSFPFARNH